MNRADRLSWTIARHVAELPAGTAFTAASSATLGVMLAQRLLGCGLKLWGHGGAYDPAGILSLHARPWLFNRRPRARITRPGVFEPHSEPPVLLATPGQVDGKCNANLSGIGNPQHPKVAFGGTRGLPDAGTVFFVLPAHSPRQLVDRVDFVSTCAANRSTPASAAQPIEEMPDPAKRLLEQLDPLGVRELDFIAGRAAQLDAFARVYTAEAELVGKQHIPRRNVGSGESKGGRS
jgi:hypothetical protein